MKRINSKTKLYFVVMLTFICSVTVGMSNNNFINDEKDKTIEYAYTYPIDEPDTLFFALDEVTDLIYDPYRNIYYVEYEGFDDMESWNERNNTIENPIDILQIEVSIEMFNTIIKDISDAKQGLIDIYNTNEYYGLLEQYNPVTGHYFYRIVKSDEKIWL